MVPRTEAKKKLLGVLLTKEERQLLGDAASKEGGTIAALLRRCGLEEARKILGE